MFTIDSRLHAESVMLTTLSLSHVLLRDDCRFPWLILVPVRQDLTELYELTREEQYKLIEEITLCSKLLKDTYTPYKINIGALGNIVSQLHIHIIARTQDDPCWPGPVWGIGTRVPYQVDELKERVYLLKEKLSLSQQEK